MVVAQFASPTFMDLSFSITMVVWAAVGGRGSLLGACIGAIGINIIEARGQRDAGAGAGVAGGDRADLRPRRCFTCRAALPGWPVMSPTGCCCGLGGRRRACSGQVAVSRSRAP